MGHEKMIYFNSNGYSNNDQQDQEDMSDLQRQIYEESLRKQMEKLEQEKLERQAFHEQLNAGRAREWVMLEQFDKVEEGMELKIHKIESDLRKNIDTLSNSF